MRLGLFGGSFDPVHLGHLRLAECCREQAQLDGVWFVPSAVQPHKPGGPIAADADRLAMLRLAIEGRPGWDVSTIELDRGGLSYTVDTLREVVRVAPDRRVFFLMGADTLHDLPNWREPAEVLALATPLVVRRAGERPPDFSGLAELVDADRLAEIESHAIAMPPIAISSRELRQRLAAGEPCDDAMPARVADYAKTRKLYRSVTPPDAAT